MAIVPIQHWKYWWSYFKIGTITRDEKYHTMSNLRFQYWLMNRYITHWTFHGQQWLQWKHGLIRLMTRQIILADQNQHVCKPTWIKFQCNGYSRNSPKSALKMGKLALKNALKKAEPNRPFICRIVYSLNMYMLAKCIYNRYPVITMYEGILAPRIFQSWVRRSIPIGLFHYPK